jgi:hypothetical protein
MIITDYYYFPDHPLSTNQTKTFDGVQPMPQQKLTIGKILMNVLKENERSLRPVIDNSIASIAHHMHQAGIITVAVSNAPSYEGIIDSFELSLGLMKTQQEIEKHCSKFLNALSVVGGPAKHAADMIHKEWTKIGLIMN